MSELIEYCNALCEAGKDAEAAAFMLSRMNEFEAERARIAAEAREEERKAARLNPGPQHFIGSDVYRDCPFSN